MADFAQFTQGLIKMYLTLSTLNDVSLLHSLESFVCEFHMTHLFSARRFAVNLKRICVFWWLFLDWKSSSTFFERGKKTRHRN